MSAARRACVLLLMVGLVPVAQAEEPRTPATNPATTGTPPPAKAPAQASKTPAASTTTTAAASTPTQAPTAQPAAPEADDELLEFLGTVDSGGDQAFLEYLSKTDLAKASKKVSKDQKND